MKKNIYPSELTIDKALREYLGSEGMGFDANNLFPYEDFYEVYRECVAKEVKDNETKLLVKLLARLSPKITLEEALSLINMLFGDLNRDN